MEYDEILHARRNFEGGSVALSYKSPLNIVRGKGCRLYDSEDEGTSFLDCVNNVAHVGHANSQV
jgi:ethanolamine-phosphate phospho-lyase